MAKKRKKKSKGQKKVRRDKKTGRFISASAEEAPPDADADSPTGDAEEKAADESEAESPADPASGETESDEAVETEPDEADSVEEEPARERSEDGREEDEDGDEADHAAAAEDEAAADRAAQADYEARAGDEADDEADQEEDADEPAAAEREPGEHEGADVEPEGADVEPDGVAAVIDVDEELDDPEARAELIAAAAALTDELAVKGDDEGERAQEASAASGGDGEQDPSAADDEVVEAEADDRALDSEIEAAHLDEDRADESREDGAPQEESSEEEGDTPIIGRDALVALHEFRQEGVATMPEERVLELGESIAPEERDRLLAAALAHVQMQDAIYRVPTESGTARRWKGLIAAFVLVMALFIAGLPPAFLVPEGPAAVSGEDRLRGVRVSLLVQAEQIEAFRVREDRLPESLVEVRSALPGIRFIRSNDRLYQLIAYLPDGEPVVYDSASPDAVFAEVASSWVTTRDDS